MKIDVSRKKLSLRARLLVWWWWVRYTWLYFDAVWDAPFTIVWLGFFNVVYDHNDNLPWWRRWGAGFNWNAD